MAEAPRHPQLTEDQLDIWLAQPVTKAYLAALLWRAGDAQDALGTGAIIDSSNAHLSHAMTHGALGKQDAYRDAAKPYELLDFYQIIFHPPEEKPEKETETNEPE
jgi:hypothetical protein